MDLNGNYYHYHCRLLVCIESSSLAMSIPSL